MCVCVCVCMQSKKRELFSCVSIMNLIGCSYNYLNVSPRTPMPVLVTEMIRDNDEVGQPERALPRTSAYYE